MYHVHMKEDVRYGPDPLIPITGKINGVTKLGPQKNFIHQFDWNKN